MSKTALVIGGGIHGVTAAIALAKAGWAVRLFERNSALLEGTSGATHNRAHRGYHYPNSPGTAFECRQGLRYFTDNYPTALKEPVEAFYLIDKTSDIKVNNTKHSAESNVCLMKESFRAKMY